MEKPQEQRVEEKVVGGTGFNSPPNVCSSRISTNYFHNCEYNVNLLNIGCNKSCLCICFLAL